VQEAKVLFQKLKITSLLDLALLLPSSYNNTTLSEKITIGEVHTFEAMVKEVTSIQGKLRITFYLSRFNKSLNSMLFRVTPYHHQLFVVGSRHYIQGKVEEYRGELQINQAKSIKKVGVITPKYTVAIKQSSMYALIEHYIFEQNLYAEGLNSREISTLLGLHYPQNMQQIEKRDEVVLKFIEAFNHLKKLRGKRADFPALEVLTGNVRPFIENLPFTLTKEQQKVIAEIKKDLRSHQKPQNV